MSDTPRTDQRAFKAAFLTTEAIVTADFARELERELAAAKAEVAKSNAERDAARRMYCVEMSRQSSEPKKFTPEWGARLFGWDCFKEVTP